MDAEKCYITKNGVRMAVLPEVMEKMELTPGQEVGDERQFERIVGNNAAVQVAKQHPDRLNGRWSGSNFVLENRPENPSDRTRDIQFDGAVLTIKGTAPSGIFQALRDAMATAMTMPEQVLQQALGGQTPDDDSEEGDDQDLNSRPHHPRPTPRI